jgi:hypothetical protein
LQRLSSTSSASGCRLLSILTCAAASSTRSMALSGSALRAGPAGGRAGGRQG